MNNLISSTLKEQDQDQVITQIKSIASEIFSSDLDELDGIGIDLGFISSQPYVHCKKYSFTERGADDDRQQCQTEWISYQNFQKINSPQSNQGPSSKPYDQIKIQKGLVKRTAYPNCKNGKKQSKKIESKQKMKSEVSEKEQKQVKSKIKLQNLEQYGFMKQTGNLKEDVIADLYMKKQKSEEEKIRPQKRFKTLQQLYAEKQPLYDKYLKEKQKRIKAIYQSRVLEEQKLDLINPAPEINNNIPVQGSFQERLKIGAKKAEEIKSKIMSDVLEGSTFRPQTNQTKKYNKVKSVVKETWIEKKAKDQAIENISFEVNAKTRYHHQYSSLKLDNTNELKRILELDDSFQM